MKHKHVDLIKKWADGAEIEYLKFDTTWVFIANPSWGEDNQYRLKRLDWQQKLIDAANAGKEVQMHVTGKWEKSKLPLLIDTNFFSRAENSFRIKPEPSPDLVKYVSVKIASGEICRWNIAAPAYANLILTFDGETGEPKSAEVIWPNR
jgi:hypothetical protein